ncbi:MAG: hypothetical protein M3O71_25760 [Bacteroidota bacterium]|nr:hypothetical protein [Bacteroidota bacterium]
MPIQPTTYPAELISELEKATTDVLSGGLMPLLSPSPGNLHISLMLDIQQLNSLRNVRIKTTEPEGIRIMVVGDSGVEAALDFYYLNDEIRFTHGLAGHHLLEFTAALNAIEQSVSNDKATFQIACLDFHYAAHPYLLAYNNRRINIYNYFKGTLLSIPQRELKQLLGHLGRNRTT